MTAWDDRGGIMVWMREEDRAFLVAPEYWELLLTAWMNGETFFAVKDLHDSNLVLKLGAVVAMSFSTPESVRLEREDDKESQFDDDD